ncbi:MAG: ribonuclease D [Alphaproteobacteria bacterium]|nr:ribonuclease D [Alphaproteobacteria bacterium]MDE2110729.1 ribonuclease D [Alphaproteobacteria bacterium]MDE2494534.1 ribonuclease D [Alphaproteobacteria bacterium]
MRIVETTADLKALAAELKGAPYIALDTEFMRDSTYWPKLCLLQIAAPGIAAIVDPQADDLDLAPFFVLLKDPHIVKVLHAGRQDIEIFWHRGRVIPDPLFDTQIVAMVCGFGEAASYETLARKIAHAEVDKSARFTDWARRPLTKRQLEYALADVTHLRTIYEALSAQIAKSKRESWVAEEIAALKSEELYALDPAHAWKRLKPRTNNKRFLATLAAVAAWREREAQTRDTPRNRVLKDDVLLEIASNPPDGAEALERIRSMPKGFAASRLGKSLLGVIEKSKNATPPEVQEGSQPHRRKREPSPAVVDLLKTLLRLRAEEARVAPRLIANAHDIERLAAGDDDGVAALQGWRAEVFGNDAIALRNGSLAIALENSEAVVIELED